MNRLFTKACFIISNFDGARPICGVCGTDACQFIMGLEEAAAVHVSNFFCESHKLESVVP